MKKIKLKTGIVKGEPFLKHIPGDGCPDTPERLIFLYSMVNDPDLKDRFVDIEPRKATRNEILLWHTPGYFDKIADTKNCVIVDPDTNITQALTNNLNACGYEDARIFVGTIGSHKKKIHSNDSYATYTESCEGDECNIENMTYDNLQRKYDITFNTIVADCEGCLPELIDHIEDMDPIKKIIFETDRAGNVDYNKLYTKLNECGFKNVREGFVQIWVK